VASALLAVPIAASASSAPQVLPLAAQTPPPPPVTWPNEFIFTADPTVYGATGAVPQNVKPSPQLLTNAANFNALIAAVQSSSGSGVLPSGPLGIPGVVLDAYLKAEQAMAVQQPGCHLPWWLLAGIGKIESNQAENGAVDGSGNTLLPILGPILDGSSGFAAIPTGGGWARAEGPMQFLTSTWARYGGGGNINNVYDAALAAGRYLCAGGLDLSVPANQATAVFSYNHSDTYVQTVLAWAYAYRQGVTPVAETPVPVQLASFSGSNPIPVPPVQSPPSPVTPPPTPSGPSTTPTSAGSSTTSPVGPPAPPPGTSTPPPPPPPGTDSAPPPPPPPGTSTPPPPPPSSTSTPPPPPPSSTSTPPPPPPPSSTSTPPPPPPTSTSTPPSLSSAAPTS
jgi:hypothetical protein